MRYRFDSICDDLEDRPASISDRTDEHQDERIWTSYEEIVYVNTRFSKKFYNLLNFLRNQ